MRSTRGGSFRGNLPMNRRIQHRVLEDTETSGSADLCVLQNSVLKLWRAAQTAWFMAPGRVQCWRSKLPMNRPTPNPSEGSTTAGARREFPSWEGSGVGSRPPCAILESCDRLYEFPLDHLHRTRRCRVAGGPAIDRRH